AARRRGGALDRVLRPRWDAAIRPGHQPEGVRSARRGRARRSVSRVGSAAGEPGAQEGEDVGDGDAADAVKLSAGVLREPGAQEGEDVGDFDLAVAVEI